jgi:hypothetical protein
MTAIVVSGCGRLEYQLRAGAGDGGLDASIPDAGRDLDATAIRDASAIRDAPAIPGDASFAAPRRMTEITGALGGGEDPALSGDALELFFISPGTEVYASRRGSVADPWPAAVRVAELSSGIDQSVGLSIDALTVWLTRDGTILASTRSSRAAAWGPLTGVSGLESPGDDRGISPYGSDLAVVLNSTRTSPNFDLYVATRPSIGAPFDAPTPLSELNTGSLEMNAFLTDESMTLYFTSDRPGTTGGRDIFVARRSATTMPWGTATTVPALDTAFDDDDFALSDDGRYGVFASNRSGAYDLYEITR